MRNLLSFILLMTVLNVFSIENKSTWSEENLFYEGKELHNNQKYAVSSRILTDFLNKYKNTDASYIEEAKALIAINSYLNNEKIALKLLTEHYNNYSYSNHRKRIAYFIGHIYFSQKKYPKTLEWYSKLSNRDLNSDESIEYLFTKGYSLIEQKQYFESANIFRTLEGLKNHYQNDAVYYLGYSLFCLEKFNEAEPILKNAGKNKKFEEAVSFHLLQIYESKKEFKNAIDAGNILIEKYPKSAYISEAYRIVGESMYMLEDYPGTVKNLTLLDKTNRRMNRYDRYILGTALYNVKEYTLAINQLSRVTNEKDSLCQNAYLCIGNSYLAIKNTDNARLSFQSAANMNFDPIIAEEALLNYSLATYESGKPYGESVIAFEKFIEKYPKSKHLDEVYSHLASAYLTAKDYKSAINSIDKIKSNNPSLKTAKEHAYFQLGMSSMLLKEYAEGEKYLNEAVKLYNKSSYSAQAYLWRGEAFYMQGKYELATKDLITFLNTTQTKSLDEKIKAFYTLGYIDFEQGRYSSAKDWFLKFYQTESNKNNKLFGDVLNRIGDCYYSERQFELAVKYYEEVNNKSIAYADYAAYQSAFIKGILKQPLKKIEGMTKLVINYPNSNYCPSAIYETGRTYILLEDYPKAINSYNILSSKYEKHPLTRKSSLEVGIVYANQSETNKAINAFKRVVELYPSSEEARVAIENLQNIYVEKNDVQSYLTYRESLSNTTVSKLSNDASDSLSFIAAEKIFAKEDYKQAIKTLKDYIDKYCDKQSINCITAHYYLAESYYQNEERILALYEFEKVCKLTGNEHIEDALSRAAELTYEKKDYEQAIVYYEHLAEVATSNELKAAAYIGVMRSSYQEMNFPKAIKTASIIIDNGEPDASIMREARFTRAKSYISMNNANMAEEDLVVLSKDLRQAEGAESKYLYAQLLFNNGRDTAAETEVMNFIERNTPHQYWLARSFILLSDIYIKLNDDFQARQYLLSLKENYLAKDDIQSMIEERLTLLAKKFNEEEAQ